MDLIKGQDIIIRSSYNDLVREISELEVADKFLKAPKKI